MNFTIDRFEGNYAIVELENRKMLNVPREILPVNAKEGDIISLSIDGKSTKERKDNISKLMEDLWN